jgi:serine/threonine protein kinase
MSTVQARKLGEKYVLLDLIGTGGMAEVYRGKLLGEKGFQKSIVIKKLLPQVAQDKEIVELFIGEARLAALLQHENIAATYDFGELDNNYFLAMEYLFGKDLYAVIQRGREHKKPLELRHALMIAAKICEGMDYAHSLKDLQNNPLNIIHRDLTPQNIFITYDGKVKVIDFGVAKAEMLDTKTRAGVVKGKVSYMSPEQISGAVIDSRSDIFSIGILLYEMISKRRMYEGDMATLIRKSITVEYEHLETIIQDLPPKLYAILDKALSSNLESRYQSCAEMQTDIENLLFSMSERPDSRVLKEYIHELFAHEHEVEQKSMVTAMETVVVNLDNETKDPGSDKTILYDTIKGDDGRKTSFVHRNLAAIHGKWKNNKKGYSLIASICFIAFVAFLSFGVKKEDVDTNAPPSAAPILPVETIDSPSVAKVVSPPSPVEVSDKTGGSNRKSEARKLARKAKKALSEQRFPEAQGFVDAGLKLSPYNQSLHTLNRQINKKKQTLIQRLADKAEQRLNEDKIAIPEDDSALYYYAEIKKIDPDSALAQAGFQEIANRYASMSDLAYYTEIQKIDSDSALIQAGFLEIADRYASIADLAYKRFDLVTAEKFVQKGLMLVPDHTRLLKLEDDLSRSHPEVYLKGVEKNAEFFLKSMGEGIEKGIEGLFGD